MAAFTIFCSLISYDVGPLGLDFQNQAMQVSYTKVSRMHDKHSSRTVKPNTHKK